MINMAVLRTEIAKPQYAGMTAQAVADALNTATQVDVDTVTGQDIFEATAPADYSALSTAQKNLYHAIIGMGILTMRGGNTRAALASMFGAGTETRANIVALQKISRSWADVNWQQRVGAHHVVEARGAE